MLNRTKVASNTVVGELVKSQNRLPNITCNNDWRMGAFIRAK